MQLMFDWRKLAILWYFLYVHYNNVNADIAARFRRGLEFR